jgi:hypothetical protein
MRRLLFLALVIALLVGSFAGVASARFADGGAGADGPVAAPFDAPAAAPRPDRSQPDSWSFRSSGAIGADLQAAPAAAATSGASATVTVTAVVLPVVFIVLDEETGAVRELVTNTDERDATNVMYLVRVGDEGGAPGVLDPHMWAMARAAMSRAVAGTGTIWTA